MDRSLLDVTSNAGHKRVPVFKVGVKIGLQMKGGMKKRGYVAKNTRTTWNVRLVPVARLYLVHDGGRRGLDTWLLVWERQLLQQVHVGQGILQGHVGRHGNKASLAQNPTLRKNKGESEKVIKQVPQPLHALSRISRSRTIPKLIEIGFEDLAINTGNTKLSHPPTTIN